MGSGGRKNIAAVKGGRDTGLEHPVLVGDFVGALETVTLKHGADDSIVRQNEELALFRFYDNRLARGSNAGIDDHQKDGSGRVIRSYAKEVARGFFNLKWCDLVGDVHDAGIGRNANDDRF